MDPSMNHGSLYEPGKGSPHFRYSPLTVTRRTSQVCRVWRHLLLNSPSIWGRVFHLDLLDQRTADWRIETLRRTGQSPLFITGEVVGVIMEDFFLALLHQEWPRIRRISVRIHNEWEFEDDVWEPLTRPTSVLESFDLSLSGDTSFPAKFRGKLFGNSAPSLAEFYPNNIKFTLQAPWVSQLRCLEVSYPFTVREVVETMRNMASLDTIILGRGVRPVQPNPDEFLPVTLPGLRNIRLTSLLETAIQFLEHVVPGKGCGLSFTSTDFMLLTTEHELEGLCRVLAQYAENYFSLYPPKRLLLNLTERFFYLRDLLDPTRLPSSPILAITIDVGPNRPPLQPILVKILTSLPVSIFNSLTTLDLLLDPQGVNRGDADLARLLHSFTCLEFLHLSSLDPLAQLQKLSESKSVYPPVKNEVIFPKLTTLKISLSVKISATILQSFLVWRKAIGVQMQTIDLTFSSPDMFGDLTFLDQFDLKIMWSGNDTVEEYECGSGEPSRLDFCRSAEYRALY